MLAKRKQQDYQAPESASERRARRSRRQKSLIARKEAIAEFDKDAAAERAMNVLLLFAGLNVFAIGFLNKWIPFEWKNIALAVSIPWGIAVLCYTIYRPFALFHETVERHGLICEKCGKSTIEPLRFPLFRSRSFSTKSRPSDPAKCYSCEADLLND